MTFVSTLTSFLAQHYCQFQDSMSGIWGPYVRAIYGENSVIGNLLTGEYAARMFCNRPSTPPPPGPPYWSGGQCNVPYRVIATGEYKPKGQPDAPGQPVFGDVTVTGPIEAIKNYPIDPKGAGPGHWLYVKAQPTLSEPQGYFRLWFVNSDFSDEPTVTSLSVTRIDGLPDNCGDPFPEPDGDDKVPYVFDVDFTYQNNDGIDITVPLILTFGFAYVDVDFNLKVPVTVNLNPDFTFSPTANFNFRADIDLGNNTINFGPPVPPGTPAPKPPAPIDYDDPAAPPPDGGDDDPPPAPDPTPDPPPKEPDEPKRAKVIVGALVTVNNPEQAKETGQLGQGDNPDVYYPDLGLVSFRIRSSKGGGWSEDIRVKNVRQIIECPWGGGAYEVKGTPRIGATMTVTPIYGYADDRFESS